MKKIFTLITILGLASSFTFATHYTIITTNNLTFSPASLVANVGDTITINGSSTHPVVQVDKATWDNLDNTPLSSGWGTKTSAYTFVLTTAGAIYYVCAVHVSFGMEGSITVAATATALAPATEKEENIVSAVKDQVLTLFGESLRGSTLYLRNSNGQTILGEQLAANQFSTKLPAGFYLLTVLNNDSAVLNEKILVE